MLNEYIDSALIGFVQREAHFPSMIHVGTERMHELMRSREFIGNKEYRGVPVQYRHNLSPNGVDCQK